MIANPKLKNFLQYYIFGILSKINKRKQHNNRKIMLYSNMGFRDNVKALYDYLIEKGYNHDYEIICSCNDYKNFDEIRIPNVRFVSCIAGMFLYFSSGYVFYCFGKIPIEPGEGQKSVQLWHGCPYKAADEGMLKGHSWKHQYYTYALATSQFTAQILSHFFSMPIEHFIICGQPRNDVLFKSWPKYDFGSCEKMVLWAPTFRYSETLGYKDCKDNKMLPVLRIEDFVNVNEYLKSKDVKVVIKLHPMQDVDKYAIPEMNHLILLSHKEFVRRRINLYKFMTQCDALITDYSSIFFDYLLIDRPVAFTEDDLDDYSDTRGFAVDNPQSLKPGVTIRTTDDFNKFIESLFSDTDVYKAERKRVNELTNEYRSGGFCQQILEILGIRR